jgi:hypothetical protein
VNGEIESLGLLVEESRSNLLTYSEDFSSAWSYIGFSSQSLDSTYTNPTGNLGTRKLIEEVGNTNNQKVLYEYYDVSNVGGNNQIFSHTCFVKPIGNRHAQLQIHNAGSPARAISVNFDLNNLNTPFSTSISGFASNVSYGVIPYPNGWYRLYVVGNTSSQDSDGTRLAFHIRIVNDSGTTVYNGDGTSGLYVYGAQTEIGAFPTSYIPTSGSTVTRTPDNVSMTGDNFSDWFNTDEGTLHMRISSTQGPQSGYPRLLMLTPAGQNSQNNSLQFIHANNSVGLGFAIWENGTIRKGYGKNVTGPEDKENIVFAYKSDGDTSVYVDGNSLTNTISNAYAQPVFGRMGIGAYPGGEGTTPRTTIESLVYYPTRLTNTQLQTLTK